MVSEAALMVLLSSERLIVPFYACVSSAAAARRRTTVYAPTHALAVNAVEVQRVDTETEDESAELATLAVVWGERMGLQVWRYYAVHHSFRYYYSICNQVSTLSYTA